MSVSPSRTGFLDLNSGASENTARQGDGTWAQVMYGPNGEETSSMTRDAAACGQ
ncbi:hypothetical protein SNOG_00682 [Parastagonospora nodorum SN15]|uniref:Uncharacterized protein n=1 Tax=Phaeosphaeria nodorum (strain SN15 / ATCC MYA-4574 / FGSC 10173) TaxID=321614 RepID=Q0V5N2_PHANO|nr:hypothetical protein SNOG_00682 [Parastagonospora nodorum SN15]EAT92177.1 hypothetical protein SNOG_00682 [Parastagonospora nodorum SN15]